MKRIAYELYNPYLTISENAQKLGCSVVSMKRYLRDKEVDRKFDGIYVKWKKVQDYYKQNPNSSLREASIELGISINTIRKYKNLSEEELSVSKKDKIKVTSFDIKNKNAIKSISYSQTDILSWIMKLYNDGKPFDCDLTASKCIFWKSLTTPQHLFDKYPQIEGVKPLSEADLLPEGYFDSLVFDLPFIVSSGAMSMIKERFTHFETLEELYIANDEMLERSYRLLSEQGLLVVKTMDICHGNKQVWISDYVIKKAYELGFEMIEKFILLSNLRLFARTHHQNVARKYHSYFLVFKKK